MLSDPIRSNHEGRAQQKLPAGAGTAPAAGEPAAGSAGAAEGRGAEIRWVGEQRLMAGYCGRAVVTGRAEVAAAADASKGEGQVARVYAVRPVALLQRPRHMVVRIGPKARGADGDGAAGPQGNGTGETQARAA